MSYQVKRFFLSMTDKKVAEFATPTLAVYAGIGTGLGAGLGILAFKIASFIPFLKPITEVMSLTSFSLGGAVAGGIAGLIYSMHKVSRSDVFREWLGNSIKKDVFPMFLDFIENDAEMADLMCTISKDYPTFPVRLPDGHVYEKEEIEKWLATYTPVPQNDPKNPNLPNPTWYNASSPFRVGERVYTVEDLQYATSHFTKIIQRMYKIRRRVLKEMRPDNIINQGLEALFNDICGDFKAYIESYEHKVLAEVEAGQMDVDEAAQRIEDIIEANKRADFARTENEAEARKQAAFTRLDIVRERCLARVTQK